MTVPDRTGNQLRIDGLSLKVHAIRIGRHPRACVLTSLFAVFLGALFVGPASAAITCTPGNVGKVLNAGAIVIPMNAPSGTVVSTVAPASFQMRCYFQNNAPYNTTATSTL